MLVVRMFLRGYLFVWLQYLVSKEEFLFLNSPRGFRRSLGQRSHFIGFIDSLIDPYLKTWLPTNCYPFPLHSHASQNSASDPLSLSDPTTLKTPHGDETRNFSKKILFNEYASNTAHVDCMFLIDHTLEKSFNSQCSNKDIFQKDYLCNVQRKCYRAIMQTFTRILGNQKQTTVSLSSDSLFQSQMTFLLLLLAAFCPNWR